MTCFFRTFACAILMFACSGVVVSQEIQNVFNEFHQGYENEFFSTPEQIQNHTEYAEATHQLYMASLEKEPEIIQKRLNDLGPNPSQEEITKISDEAWADSRIALQKSLVENTRKTFPDEQYQRIQQRRFQMRESVMRRLESFNDHEESQYLMFLSPAADVLGHSQPDFLDLTPEQRELITRQQKDTAINMQVLMRDTVKKGIVEKSEELQQLTKLLGEIPIEKRGEAETQEIMKQIKRIQTDITKNAFPELKKILLKSREDYMRVLTDAQKAKIDAVMDDMPDYMKNLFAEIDRQGGGLSILQLWQPGMGVPDMPNPNREAPRERPKSERVFPQ